MSSKTGIEWTEATWNIAVGCEKVDQDCARCYMYRDSYNGTRYNPRQIRKTKSVFTLPLKLKEPKKIFTCSLTDFFHPAIDEYRVEAWDIIRRCPQHTFQILTKRPERILDNLPPDWGAGWSNVWMGTSIGSNAGLVRLPYLQSIPAKTRFVSFEPLLEDIELSPGQLHGIDWVIIGGESGNKTGPYKYRPCNIDWFAYLHGVARAAGCAVFIKQLGTYLAREYGLQSRHGKDPDEWPFQWMKTREFPK